MSNLERDIKSSIIISVYKVLEQYLRNCLKNITKQKI